PGKALNVVVLHVGVAGEYARQQGRHGKEVQHIVAEIRGQHRALVAHADDVPHRVLLTLQHVHRLAVRDDVRPAELGQRDAGTVGKAAQQRPVEIDLALEVRFRKRLPRHGEQDDGEQIDRGDRGGGVDVAHDAAGEVIDGCGDPRRAGVLIERARAPAALVAVQNGFQRDGLAEVDVHTPEALPELAERLHETEHRFLLLGLAGKLTDVGGAFENALVAEIHGQEDHRPGRIAEEAAHRHGEHPGLRLQQPARAAAAAFDEILDGVAARHDGGQVFHEDDGVEAVAAEFAADEEGAAHAQQPADDGEIEVDAGGNVRYRIAVDVDDVREQQII